VILNNNYFCSEFKQISKKLRNINISVGKGEQAAVQHRCCSPTEKWIQRRTNRN